jgi:cell division protein FtsZ
MSVDLNNDALEFDLPKNQSSPIKVIGVGGGGSNAVNYMFEQGISGVDFVICNTDRQALENSSIPNKVQLGSALTEGLGAGANPQIGREAAEESVEDLRQLLQRETKMAFITAGMGGGTGTGAAPVLARLAREMDILTVGIVTMPFGFEGKSRLSQAEEGLKQLREYVDSLIVINNNKLREAYGNLGFKSGFAKADEVLASAARGIAEVITKHYMLNIDLKDAKTVLGNSGKAIMGKASASGEDRSRKAICAALDSPLLNDNKITGCKNVLLLIISGEEEITIDEMGEINDYIQDEAGGNANIIMGMGEDPDLGSAISVTVIATGFTGEQAKEEGSERKVIHVLNDKEVKEPTPTAPAEIENSLAENSQEKQEEPNLFSWGLEDEDHSKSEMNSPEAEEPVDESDEKVVHVLELQDEDMGDDGFMFATDSEESENETVAEQTEEPSDEGRYVKPSAFNFFEMPHQQIEGQAESSEVETAVEEELQASEDDTIRYTLTAEEDEDQDDAKGGLEDYVFSDDNEDEFGFELIIKDEPSDVTIEEDIQGDTAKSSDLKSVEEAPEKVFSETQESTEAPISKNRVTREDERKREMEDSYEGSVEASRRRADERRARLNQFNHKFNKSSKGIERLENEPAYKRKGVELNDTPHSSDQPKSQFTLTDDEEGTSIKTKNSFLHDNVD